VVAEGAVVPAVDELVHPAVSMTTRAAPRMAVLGVRG
jgi:hypothetical protein